MSRITTAELEVSDKYFKTQLKELTKKLEQFKIDSEKRLNIAASAKTGTAIKSINAYIDSLKRLEAQVGKTQAATQAWHEKKAQTAKGGDEMRQRGEEAGKIYAKAFYDAIANSVQRAAVIQGLLPTEQMLPDPTFTQRIQAFFDSFRDMSSLIVRETDKATEKLERMALAQQELVGKLNNTSQALSAQLDFLRRYREAYETSMERINRLDERRQRAGQQPPLPNFPDQPAANPRNQGRSNRDNEFRFNLNITQMRRDLNDLQSLRRDFATSDAQFTARINDEIRRLSSNNLREIAEGQTALNSLMREAHERQLDQLRDSINAELVTQEQANARRIAMEEQLQRQLERIQNTAETRRRVAAQEVRGGQAGGAAAGGLQGGIQRQFGFRLRQEDLGSDAVNLSQLRRNLQTNDPTFSAAINDQIARMSSNSISIIQEGQARLEELMRRSRQRMLADLQENLARELRALEGNEQEQQRVRNQYNAATENLERRHQERMQQIAATSRQRQIDAPNERQRGRIGAGGVIYETGRDLGQEAISAAGGLGPFDGIIMGAGPAGLAIAGVATAYKKATEAAIEFEDNAKPIEMLLSPQQAVGLNAEMEKLRDTAMETGEPLSSLQGSFENLVSSVDAFGNDLPATTAAVKNVALIAKATKDTAENAAVAFTGTAQAAGLAIENIEEQAFVTDALAHTMNVAVDSAGVLNQYFARGVPPLKQLAATGREAIEVNGSLITVFTKQGLNMETATDRVKAFANVLLNANSRAKLLDAGLQGLNEQGRVTDWDALVKSIASDVNKFTNAGISEQAAEAFRFLAAEGGKMFTDTRAGFKNMAGEAQRSYDIMSETAESKWNKIKAIGNDILISMGQDSSGIAKDVMDTAAGILTGIAEMARPAEQQFEKLMAASREASREAAVLGMDLANFQSQLATGLTAEQGQEAFADIRHELDAIAQASPFLAQQIGAAVTEAENLANALAAQGEDPTKAYQDGLAAIIPQLTQAQQLLQAIGVTNAFEAQEQAAAAFSEGLDAIANKQTGFWNNLMEGARDFTEFLGLDAVARFFGGQTFAGATRLTLFEDLPKQIAEAQQEFDKLSTDIGGGKLSGDDLIDAQAAQAEANNRLNSLLGAQAKLQQTVTDNVERTTQAMVQQQGVSAENLNVDTIRNSVIASIAERERVSAADAMRMPALVAAINAEVEKQVLTLQAKVQAEKDAVIAQQQQRDLSQQIAAIAQNPNSSPTTDAAGRLQLLIEEAGVNQQIIEQEAIKNQLAEQYYIAKLNALQAEYDCLIPQADTNSEKLLQLQTEIDIYTEKLRQYQTEQEQLAIEAMINSGLEQQLFTQFGITDASSATVDQKIAALEATKAQILADKAEAEALVAKLEANQTGTADLNLLLAEAGKLAATYSNNLSGGKLALAGEKATVSSNIAALKTAIANMDKSVAQIDLTIGGLQKRGGAAGRGKGAGGGSRKSEAEREAEKAERERKKEAEDLAKREMQVRDKQRQRELDAYKEHLAELAQKRKEEFAEREKMLDVQRRRIKEEISFIAKLRDLGKQLADQVKNLLKSSGKTIQDIKNQLIPRDPGAEATAIIQESMEKYSDFVSERANQEQKLLDQQKELALKREQDRKEAERLAKEAFPLLDERRSLQNRIKKINAAMAALEDELTMLGKGLEDSGDAANGLNKKQNEILDKIKKKLAEGVQGPKWAGELRSLAKQAVQAGLSQFEDLQDAIINGVNKKYKDGIEADEFAKRVGTAVENVSGKKRTESDIKGDISDYKRLLMEAEAALGPANDEYKTLTSKLKELGYSIDDQTDEIKRVERERQFINKKTTEQAPAVEAAQYAEGLAAAMLKIIGNAKDVEESFYKSFSSENVGLFTDRLAAANSEAMALFNSLKKSNIGKVFEQAMPILDKMIADMEAQNNLTAEQIKNLDELKERRSDLIEINGVLRQRVKIIETLAGVERENELARAKSRLTELQGLEQLNEEQKADIKYLEKRIAELSSLGISETNREQVVALEELAEAQQFLSAMDDAVQERIREQDKTTAETKIKNAKRVLNEQIQLKEAELRHEKTMPDATSEERRQKIEALQEEVRGLKEQLTIAATGESTFLDIEADAKARADYEEKSSQAQHDFNMGKITEIELLQTELSLLRERNRLLGQDVTPEEKQQEEAAAKAASDKKTEQTKGGRANLKKDSEQRLQEFKEMDLAQQIQKVGEELEDLVDLAFDAADAIAEVEDAFARGNAGEGIAGIGNVTKMMGEALLGMPYPLNAAGAVLLGVGAITSAIGKIIAAFEPFHKSALQKAQEEAAAQERVLAVYQAQLDALDKKIEYGDRAVDQAWEEYEARKAAFELFMATDPNASLFAGMDAGQVADQIAELKGLQADIQNLQDTAAIYGDDESSRSARNQWADENDGLLQQVLGPNWRDEYDVEGGITSAEMNRITDALAAAKMAVDDQIAAGMTAQDWLQLQQDLRKQIIEEAANLLQTQIEIGVDLKINPGEIVADAEAITDIYRQAFIERMKELGYDLSAMTDDEIKRFTLALINTPGTQFSPEDIEYFNQFVEALNAEEEALSSYYEKMTNLNDLRSQISPDDPDYMSEQEANEANLELMNEQLATAIQMGASEEYILELKQRIYQLQQQMNAESDETLNNLVQQRQELLAMSRSDGVLTAQEQANLAAIEAQILARMQQTGKPQEEIDWTKNAFEMQRYHSGGPIEGRLGAEVPIVAQAGEYMLSRPDVTALGGHDAIKAMLLAAKTGNSKTSGLPANYAAWHKNLVNATNLRDANRQQMFINNSNNQTQHIGEINLNGGNANEVWRQLEPKLDEWWDRKFIQSERLRGRWRG
jgi:hypothetical protein